MTQRQDNKKKLVHVNDGRRPEEEDVETAEWLTEGMQRFDDAFESGTPSLEQLTALVDATRKEASSKLWRDLVLLWAAGCVVLGGMALAWLDDVIWVVGIQAVGAVAGVAYLCGMLARRSGKGLKGKWTS
jgi:hypothetical protein